MSSRPHHRGLHHQQHPSSAAHDAAGWVESISALSDEHPATALLLGSPPAARPVPAPHTTLRPGSSSSGGDPGAQQGASPLSPAAAAPAGVDGEGPAPACGTAAAAAAAAGPKLSPQEEFDACLEHAVDVMLTEVREGGALRRHGSLVPTAPVTQPLWHPYKHAHNITALDP
jgi:hypothetical protein